MPGALWYAVIYVMVWVVIGSQRTIEHIGCPETSVTNQSTLHNILFCNVCVCVCVCMCGFCNVCVCEGFVMCGCFGNIYTVL